MMMQLDYDTGIVPRIRSRQRVKLLLIDAALQNRSISHWCGGFQSGLYISLSAEPPDYSPDIMVWRYNTDVMELKEMRQTISQLRLNPLWSRVQLNEAIEIVDKTIFAKAIKR
jgi:hypothetical protein